MGVPRQNPIPAREIEICERLRQARASTHLSQVAFARLLDIDSSRLASYEHARVPIKFELAVKAASLARVSLQWLAEGGDGREAVFSVDPKLRERIPKNQLFSKVYDEWLKAEFDAALKNVRALTGGRLDAKSIAKFADDPAGHRIGNIGPEDLLKILSLHLKNLIWTTPPNLFQELSADIFVTTAQFHRRNESAINAFPTNKLPKYSLTDDSLKRNTSGDMKSEVQKLIERVKRKAAAPGARADLARTLDVAPARVSEWLSGKKEPGGDYALRLLKWVET